MIHTQIGNNLGNATETESLFLLGHDIYTTLKTIVGGVDNYEEWDRIRTFLHFAVDRLEEDVEDELEARDHLAKSGDSIAA